MSYDIAEVSNAELGQLRPPTQDEIDRRIARADWTRQEQREFSAAMRRLEHAASAFVTQAHGRSRDTPTVAAPPREDHRSVTQSRYTDRDAAKPSSLPSHSAIRRSIDAHIRHNMQRAASRERFRQLGQRLRQQIRDTGRRIGRAVPGQEQQAAPPGNNQKPIHRQEPAEVRQASAVKAYRDYRNERDQARQQERQAVRSLAREQHPPQRAKEQSRGRAR